MGEAMKPSKSPVSSIPEGVTEEAVRPQLTRILSSASFRDSPQLSSFLSFIVESTLSGQAYRIKQYTIAIDALNYSKDFDPQTNTAVRVLGSRLRELLTLYYLQEGANDELRIEIPRRTYIPVFQPNLMLHAPPDQSKVPLSVVPAAMEDYGLSIAVIPFSNTGKNSRSHADSITELIVTGLIQFRELHIIGPIDEYKNCVVKTDEIAQRYHARFILQGRVEMLEGTFRISAGLTDTRSGFKIWSQNYTYDKDSLSLFKGEEDLSRQIVSAIANYIGVIPCLIGQESIKKNRYSLESYEAIYILSRFLRVLTKTALHDAVEALEFAMKTEPENPIVLATLSHACCINYLFDLCYISGRSILFCQATKEFDY
jgi:TolB-like protein